MGERVRFQPQNFFKSFKHFKSFKVNRWVNLTKHESYFIKKLKDGAKIME